LKNFQQKSGAAMVEVLFEFMIVMALILCFLALWKPFIQKQNIDYVAKTLVRAVETNGRIDSSIVDLQHELENNLGLDIDTVTWNATYLPGTNKIQIKSKFSVTLEDSASIKLFEPSFSAPVEIHIPIKKTFTGVSQVFWK
jgi:hypothetical protein